MNLDEITSGKWRNVVCPLCLSSAGRDCVTSKGKSRGNVRRLPHAVRLKKAKA